MAGMVRGARVVATYPLVATPMPPSWGSIPATSTTRNQLMAGVSSEDGQAGQSGGHERQAVRQATGLAGEGESPSAYFAGLGRQPQGSLGCPSVPAALRVGF